MSLEIEKMTDLWKVLEELILNNRVEFTLREVLGIAKKEFHDTILDLIKRKRLLTKPKSEKPVEVKAAHIDKVAMEKEFTDNHYMRPH